MKKLSPIDKHCSSIRNRTWYCVPFGDNILPIMEVRFPLDLDDFDSSGIEINPDLY
jgi:hypothetical protein